MDKDTRRAQIAAALRRRKVRLKEAGICQDCGKRPPVNDKTLCRPCLDVRCKRANFDPTFRHSKTRPRVLLISSDAPLAFALNNSQLFTVLRVESLDESRRESESFDPALVVFDLRDPVPDNALNPLQVFAYDNAGEEIKIIVISPRDDSRFYYDLRIWAVKYLTATLIDTLNLYCARKRGPKQVRGDFSNGEQFQIAG